jgi:hypothetical protein
MTPSAPMPKQGRLKPTTDQSVPDGDRYILIFGGESPYVFVNPTPKAFHASLTDADRRMLAMRQGERQNVMMVEGEVRGPAGKDRRNDMEFSPGIQIGSQCWDRLWSTGVGGGCQRCLGHEITSLSATGVIL